MKPMVILLHSRKLRVILVVFGILLLLSAVCLYRACFQPLGDDITLGGVEIGGMVPTRARQVLE
jgi:hypothetical protein